MSFRPEEVSAVLAQELERYEAKLDTKSVGSVLSVGDGIARVWGLEDAKAGELLEFPGGVRGMVLNLEEDNVGAAIMGPYEKIREGDTVKRTGEIASVPVGKALLYVEPIYLQSKSNDLPTLVRVVVTDGRRFVMDRDLDQALKRLVATGPATPLPEPLQQGPLGRGALKP